MTGKMAGLITRSILGTLCLLLAVSAQADEFSVVSDQLSVKKNPFCQLAQCGDQNGQLLAKKDGKDGRWDRLSDKDREKLRKRREKYESMSPEEKERIRRARDRYEQLPPQQREKLRKRWEDMTPEERRRYKLEERRYR